jgi:NADPH-dependent curcumin reductase CurA
MTVNRFWRLDNRPQGQDFASALSFQQEDLAPLGAGEVRIRNQYLSMDAGTRMWMSARTDGYQPPLPLGAKMVGLGVGRITESRDPRFPEGALARCFGQWADYTTVPADGASLALLDEGVGDPRHHIGALGMNGWTALVGVRETAAIRPGEWIAVSAAAGATGSLACQIARNLGARVIGIAGGPEKAAFLRDKIGVDVAIDYRNQDVSAEIARIGEGVNAYFDNVGVPLLDAVIPHMALHGRIAVCGLVATYDSDTPLPGPATFDQVLMKRLRIEGFFLPDHLDRAGEFFATLSNWVEEGKLFVPFDETEGLENVLTGYARMLTGRNIGKVVVKVA